MQIIAVSVEQRCYIKVGALSVLCTSQCNANSSVLDPETTLVLSAPESSYIYCTRFGITPNSLYELNRSTHPILVNILLFQWSSANGNTVNDSSSGTSTKNQRRRHHDSDDKSFACQYDGCDKAFYRKDHLVRHQRQKHGKPYGVDSQIVFYCHNTDCNKMFYKVSTLRRHMVEAHNYGNSFWNWFAFVM